MPGIDGGRKWEGGGNPEVSDELKKQLSLEQFEKRREEIDEKRVVIESGIYRIEIQHDISVNEEYEGDRLVKRVTYDSRVLDMDVVETYSYRSPKDKHPCRIDVFYDVHKDK